ncbi:hypothetical protein [Paenibacillus peoriae]|uniref:hypothetical protein n=1 Tax=Paenibacillus peoriae TaxID=59893 RepID=UPI001CC1C4CC|nr:hypothetical protein [Paenibacillus peoriae]
MGEIRKIYDVIFKKKTVDLYLKKGIGYKNVAKQKGLASADLEHAPKIWRSS